jgi:hemerythrin-like domain-containing protein
MKNATTHWHGEHLQFNRLLERLGEEVDRFATAERPNYELMLDIITYLREFTDRVHHPREDVAFARLAERLPELRPRLKRLQQEHRIIANAGETLRNHLSAVLAGSIVARDTVEAAAAIYLVYYANHIAKEEEEILPRASAMLTREDWAAVLAAVPDPRLPIVAPRLS